MSGDETIGDMAPESAPGQPKQDAGLPAKGDQARGRTVTFSRPKDDSFEAYKAWILSMMRALTGQDNDDMTEDEWREGWQQFWAGRPAAMKAQAIGQAAARLFQVCAVVWAQIFVFHQAH